MNIPQEIQDRIFLELNPDTDFETLEKTRDIQSPYVRQCTQFNNMVKAAKCGNLDNIKWLHTNGHKWITDEYFGNSYVFQAAIKFGDFNIIKWLYENGCPLGYELIEIAAENEDFECMKWLHEKGCKLSPDLFQISAKLGNLDIMKWLYENGCSLDDGNQYDESIFSSAARNGNLDNMKWLRENGCPWDEFVFIGTIEFAYNTDNIDQVLDNMKWLLENNCPYRQQVFSEAIDLGDIKIIRWLYNNLDELFYHD